MRTYSSVQGAGGPGDEAEIEDPAFTARIEAAIHAEPRAVEELVREFQPNLTAYARSRRFPEPDAVVNEALSDGLQNLPTFRGRTRRAFRAYLYRILRRRIVDEYRRSGRQPDTVSGVPIELEANLIDTASSTFDEGVVAKSTVDEILAQLTIDQREVLEMRVLTGLSIKETAEKTGRSESAVKAMHRRALRSLRTFIVAAAIVVIGILGIRLLLGFGGGVTVVDNSPATGGDQSLGFDSRPEVPFVEVEVEVEVEVDDDGSFDDGSPDGSEAATAAAGEGAVVPPEPRIMLVGDPVTVTEPRPDPTESAPGGPGSGAGQDDRSTTPVSVCTVRTDAKPKAGEVAFVSFDFSGAFRSLESTAIDVPGADATSALFPGTGGTGAAKHGRPYPIILDKSMFGGEDAVDVSATLAAGTVQARCAVSPRALPAPCVVETGDDPMVGDRARITFRSTGPWSQLSKREAHPIAPGRTSALVDETVVELGETGPHLFTLTRNMMNSKRPWVALAILGPSEDAKDEGAKRPFGRAVCEVS